ncbi:MAG: ABC transporter ATP-binding protein [Alphaproteobacteria bacterium]|nr:ABC transporter ATP-binding protein [Alphaproteobacteria bacterium]
MSSSSPLLDIADLRVSFPGDREMIEVVRGVHFTMSCQERLAIIGESGSGKSQIVRAIMGLTSAPGQVTARRLSFDGQDLLSLNRKQRRLLCGSRMSMVMQDPRHAFNPSMKIGAQLCESCFLSLGSGKSDVREQGLFMLKKVGFRDPDFVFSAYPHELSGGMCQRALIAMMLMPRPDLLIADESISGMDNVTRSDILSIFNDFVTQQGMSLLLVSHDLKLVSSFCDRVIVMFRGQIMEEISASDLWESRHPYTQGLLKCLPDVSAPRTILPSLPSSFQRRGA